jgi:methylated-DNA-[protein]-cysteine S-methyltransferase
VGRSIGADLESAYPISSQAIERLRANLERSAARDGLVDVWYRVVDSPLGALLVAATPVGLVRLAFALEDHDVVLGALAAGISPRLLRGGDRLDDVARQLDEYFDRRRTRFELAVDGRLSRGFRRTVLECLAQDIGYGERTTYLELARRSGSPRAVRAVGTACATNPIPIVVPCHRVVRSDGRPGGYRGGADAKRVLLELESSSKLVA